MSLPPYNSVAGFLIYFLPAIEFIVFTIFLTTIGFIYGYYIRAHLTTLIYQRTQFLLHAYNDILRSSTDTVGQLTQVVTTQPNNTSVVPLSSSWKDDYV